MGVGRRMKKQGPPELLSEEHFANLKRKAAGLPVEDGGRESRSKKKHKASKPEPRGKIDKKLGSTKANGSSMPFDTQKKGKKVPNPKAKPHIAEDEELDSLNNSELQEERLSDLEDATDALLGDEFLGSDLSDDVVDSDVEQGGQELVFSDDSGDSDLEKLTAANIEGLSRKLDKQLEKDALDAQLELEEAALQTNIDGDKPQVFDEDDSNGNRAKTDSQLAPDLQLLRNRISETVRVLESFSKLGEEGRSRAEYTSQLLKDICAYYGYSEYLAEKLINLFPIRECIAWFDANETPRPVVIRTNTLKTSRRMLAQALINRGVTLEPVKFSKVGLQVFESNVPLGATPEYLAGHYILQAASSFLPVMALDVQEGQRCLDMSAAPGGKTTHMAAVLKNTGVIVANDASKARAKGLIGNIHRLGARNVIVSNYDAREFPKVMGGFDRVLLDAPCSGTGVIAKDPSIKTNKDEKDLMLLSHTQKQLILAAIDSARPGGFIVYSTCSVMVEENEGVVAYCLKRRPNVRLVATDLTFGREGFTSYMGKQFGDSLKLTRRYYPHHSNVDGFFVAKLHKFAVTPANAVLADGSTSGPPTREDRQDYEEVDKTPLREDDGSQPGEDDFGGFDDDADEQYIQRAKRNAMRRRGLDPRALDRKTGTVNLKKA